MSLERRISRREGIVARRIGGETILVPVTRRAQEMGLFTLNEVGTFVWERLDGDRPLGEIVADVTAHYDVESERAREDLLGFVELLSKAGCAGEVGS